MTDAVEFDIAAKRAGLSRSDIADALGISLMGLFKKVHNKSEFKASELAKLYRLFNLDTIDSQRKIFFAGDVEK